MSASASDAQDQASPAGQATLSFELGRVLLKVQGAVDVQVWRAIRDAREAALEKKLPLHVDLGACTHMDCGGFGALLLAADRLGQLAITGCGEGQAAHLKVLRVCAACAGDSGTHCPNKPALATRLIDWLPRCA
jgi:ABC-type transporter Mla MlaB component